MARRAGICEDLKVRSGSNNRFHLKSFPSRPGDGDRNFPTLNDSNRIREKTRGYHNQKSNPRFRNSSFTRITDDAIRLKSVPIEPFWPNKQNNSVGAEFR